ncbi:MAG: DUF86 domain-containing protein [Deltaproteobacteria bacterium]|nr:DUF86 domain-containing protein [Deltaproteobacteria bacterium]
MRDDQERLRDILEAIDNIESEADKGKSTFEQDRLVQSWIIRHLTIIGEAASKISQPLRNAEQEIPWSLMVAMRNILVHEYFGVDLNEVWQAVERDLPTLKASMIKLLQKLE